MACVKLVHGRRVALFIQRFQALFGEVGLEGEEQNQGNARRHKVLLLFSPRNQPCDAERRRGGQSTDERGAKSAGGQRHSRVVAFHRAEDGESQDGGDDGNHQSRLADAISMYGASGIKPPAM